MNYQSCDCQALEWGQQHPKLKEATAWLRAEIPIVFIHGEADDLVPFSMTQANYEMCKGEKYIFTTPDALHCMSYLMEPDKYNKILGKFPKCGLI